MAILEVTNLRKPYGTTVAVDDVSFTVEEGEIFGILGPNGAGKTTTVECVAGLRTPDGGDDPVLGLDPRRDRAAADASVLGVQLQESELPDKLRSARRCELYASFYPSPADWRRAARRARARPTSAHARFGKLSGGQKQRLSIALALVGNPRVAVLDELTTGLDPQARRDTWELIEQIRARGVTVVLVTHFMEEAERLCDRVAVIDAGRVVALDTPAGLVVQRGRRAAHALPPAEPLDDGCSPRCPRSPSVTPARRPGRGHRHRQPGARGDLRARPQPDHRRRPAGRAGQPRRRLRRPDRPRLDDQPRRPEEIDACVR